MLRRLKTTEIDAQGLESSKTVYLQPENIHSGKQVDKSLINLTNVQKFMRKVS